MPVDFSAGYENLTDRKKRKFRYREKLEKALATYKNILIVNVDNVGSNQMQKVRIALRGSAEILMGKNTLMRKVIRDQAAALDNPKLLNLLPYVVDNIGFVFTNNSLTKIRAIILENKVPAAAKSNAIAPIDVYVPPGPTGLDPGQTAFFQALNISTKIARGSIEILTTVHLIRAGEKVSSSHVALLTKLNIRPFFYGIKVQTVYEDGSIYDASILDLTDDDLTNKFFNGVRMVAALCLQIGYPTLASVPHSFNNAFKKVLAVALATEYTFPEAQTYKDFLENPEAFAAASGAAAGGDDAAEAAPVEEEEEEESDAEVGGAGLFGDEGY